MQSDTEAREAHDREESSAWSAARSRTQRWVPVLAVASVAITAVVTAVMVTQGDTANFDADGLARATKAQGAAPVCRDCGFVESVVALEDLPTTSAGGFRLRIRMDDGSVRTVEQPAALVMGARVMVDGGSARPIGRAVPG